MKLPLDGMFVRNWVFKSLFFLLLSFDLQAESCADRFVAVIAPASTGALMLPHWVSEGRRVLGVATTADESDYYRMGIPLEFLDGGELHTVSNPSERAAFLDLLKRLRRPDDPDSLIVVAGADAGIKLAAEINAELELPYADDPTLIRAQTDKYFAQRRIEEMTDARRQEFEQVGLGAIPGVLATEWKQARSWLLKQEPGVYIMKPPNSAGGHGQLIFDTRKTNWEAEAAEHYESLIGTLALSGQEIYAMIVEKFIDGIEFAVDTVSVPGQHIITDVLKYSRPIDEAGHTVLDHDQFAAFEPPIVSDFLAPAARLVLESLGKKYGPAHLEFRVVREPDGSFLVYLIEANLRMCGAGLPPFAAINTGRDPARLAVTCYTNPEAIRKMPVGYELQKPAAAIFLHPQGSGRYLNEEASLALFQSLESFVNVDWAKALTPDGDSRVLPAKVRNDRSVIGSVWLRHDDPKQIEKDMAQIRIWEAEGRFEFDG